MTDQFDEWLRGTMPDVSENETRKEIHLAILKERLRARGIARRNRYLKRGLLAVPVLLLVVLVGNVSELGSDGFGLVQLESTETLGRVFKNEFRGGGFNILDDKTDEEIYEYSQQLAAGEGVNISATGWKANGMVLWSIIREFTVMGKVSTVSMSAEEPPSNWPREMSPFFTEHWAQYEQQVLSGEIQPAGEIVQVLDGKQFLLEYWLIPTEDYGEVIYYSGLPVR